jgi:hypothetical protein
MLGALVLSKLHDKLFLFMSASPYRPLLKCYSPKLAITMPEVVKLNDCGGGESGLASAKGIIGVIWG